MGTMSRIRLPGNTFPSRPTRNHKSHIGDGTCQKKLVVQQMDVKGAYLNGILKERVYMHQPEGFEDGTRKICLLVKTLYGLKQSGHEWIIQFDVRVRKHSFLRLCSDPCVYVQRQCKGNLEIITVWVDDLLLFATSVKLMSEMKGMIQGEWEVTDLR